MIKFIALGRLVHRIKLTLTDSIGKSDALLDVVYLLLNQQGMKQKGLQGHLIKLGKIHLQVA
jgi:hypothetical protein